MVRFSIVVILLLVLPFTMAYPGFSEPEYRFSITPQTLEFGTTDTQKTLTLSVNDDAIWHQGWYSSDRNEWVSFTFPDTETDGWILDGQATQTLTIPKISK